MEAFPDGQGLVNDKASHKDKSKDNGSDCVQDKDKVKDKDKERDKSLFRGKNFVFDSRVAVSAGSTTTTTTTTTTSPLNTTNDGDDCHVNGGISGVARNENVSSSSGSSSSRSSSSTVADAIMTSEQQQEPELEPLLEVVGRCLDCSTPFDQFSGTVVCTVCRLPVLVCPSCRVHRYLPGKYIQQTQLNRCYIAPVLYLPNPHPNSLSIALTQSCLINR